MESNGQIDAGQLSARELERIELSQSTIQKEISDLDKMWPQILKGAGLMHDCYEALIQNKFTEEQALHLAGSLAQMLWRK